jgi:glutathione S-transferase
MLHLKSFVKNKMGMKLYYAKSVCSLTVRIVLHELNIPFEDEAVNLKEKKTHSGADYLSINPKGSVPALEIHDKEILTENAVILQYLADTHQLNFLLPPLGQLNRYRTLEWLNFVSTDLHRHCSPLFWSKVPQAVKDDLYWPTLNRKLAIVETQLQKNTYLMGDEFTLPDSYLFVILIWLAKLKAPMDDWPSLVRFFKTMRARASVQVSLREEELESLDLVAS